LRLFHAYRYVRVKQYSLAEREEVKMQFKHRIRINVKDGSSEANILEGAECRLPTKFLRFLFGDFTTVYLLSPGQNVESVEVHEVKGGVGQR